MWAHKHQQNYWGKHLPAMSRLPFMKGSSSSQQWLIWSTGVVYSLVSLTKDWGMSNWKGSAALGPTSSHWFMLMLLGGAEQITTCQVEEWQLGRGWGKLNITFAFCSLILSSGYHVRKLISLSTILIKSGWNLWHWCNYIWKHNDNNIKQLVINGWLTNYKLPYSAYISWV